MLTAASSSSVADRVVASRMRRANFVRPACSCRMTRAPARDHPGRDTRPSRLCHALTAAAERRRWVRVGRARGWSRPPDGIGEAEFPRYPGAKAPMTLYGQLDSIGDGRWPRDGKRLARRVSADAASAARAVCHFRARTKRTPTATGSDASPPGRSACRLAIMNRATLVAGAAVWMALTPKAASGQGMTTFDQRGSDIDVLRGVTVWQREGRKFGRSRLMRQLGGNTSRIPGTRGFTSVHELDLGIDRAGRVVLVYDRCHGGVCRGPYVVDVRRGGPRVLRLPRRRGCVPGFTASMWRDQIAYTQRCRDGGSGVYLARGGRAHLVHELSFSAAKDRRLDLNSRFLLSGSDIYSPAGRPCQVPPRRPTPERYGITAIDAHANRLWWIRERENIVEGGFIDPHLVTAAVGPGCTVQPPSAPRPLTGDLFPSGLAVAGDKIYIDDVTSGIVTGPRPPPARQSARQDPRSHSRAAGQRSSPWRRERSARSWPAPGSRSF